MSDYPLDNNFVYHAADEDQAARYTIIRQTAKDFAALILRYTPDSREQALALTNLEQAVFWANAAVARNGFSINDVAIRVNSELKSLEEESFVETSSNPRRTELRQMLDLIKIIIATRKKENEEATEAARKASLRKQIMDTIAAKEKDQLSTMSIDELRELANTL